MKIKFLKHCDKVRTSHHVYCGDGCCSWDEWYDEFYAAGEELDPEEAFHNVDISSLTYKVDYEILEYP